MQTDSFIVAYLSSPREKWWGMLKSLTPSGITLRGLSLDSFEPWARAVARREECELFPSTVFFPMNRVERIYEDETTLSVPSMADRFLEWTGEDVRIHLFPIAGQAQ